MMIGIDRLVSDLSDLGYVNIARMKDPNGLDYAVIKDFEIRIGSFADRIIDLAIPAPADYPRSLGASMHIKATPHLAPFGQVQGIRNVVNSPLGGEWQYWSYAFRMRPLNPTTELISQINEIFRKN